MYINNNIYNNNRNVNFQAKVKIEGVKLPSEKRWTNIGKILEQKTAKYPNDSIEITAYDDYNGSRPVLLEFQVGGEHSFATIKEKGLKKLSELDDNKVANKILKLFRVHKKNDKIGSAAYRLVDFIEESSQNAIKQDRSFPDFEKPILSSVFDVRAKNEQYAIGSDRFFSNPDYFEFSGDY